MLDVVLSILGTILYPLFSIIFLLIDMVQTLFYAFAGIGEISFGDSGNMWTSTQITSGNTGAENDSGIVYFLLNNSLVKNMLMSIMLLALFLIIIFTVMAFIKNAYSAKPKGWKDIVGNAIKGLANFIFLPVCVLLGVWLGNILLQAINGATSNGGSTSMSRKLFIACAYNANVYRNIGHNTDGADQEIKDFLKLHGMENKFEVLDGQDAEYYANLVDQIYSYTGNYENGFSGIDIHNHFTVGRPLGFYNVAQINYLVLVVGGIFMLYALGSLSFAMVKRLFYILVLFIVSPAVCALYPLDDGKAVGSWRDETKKQVLSAYGAVAGLNIFFSLIPLIDNIGLGGNAFTAIASSVLFNDFLQLFILVCGLLVVKDLIGLISGFVGGDNAYSTGSSLFSATRGAMSKWGGAAAKKASGAFATIKANSKRGFWGSLGANSKAAAKSLGLGTLKEVTGINWEKDVYDTYDSTKKKVGAIVETDGKIGAAKDSINTASTKKQKAEDFERQIREQYAQLKNKETDKMSQEEKDAHITALRSARGKIGAAAKTSREAGRDLDAAYASVREDLKGWSTEKLAKKLGVSTEDLKGSLNAGTEASTFSANYHEARVNAQAMVDALELASKGDRGKAKDLGLDLDNLSKVLKKSFDELINLFKNGVAFDLSDKSLFKTDAQRIAGTQFNKALEKQEAKVAKADKIGSDYVEHLLAQDGKFIDSAGHAVKFDDKAIAQLKDALKSKVPEDLDATVIATMIREETRKQENTVAKQLSTLKDIEKAIKDSNKK